jgi:hypothetical protein
MAKSASRTSAHTARTAEARFRELLDELRLLTVAFPHLREAFDPEDLPVSFLLRRGADRAARRGLRSPRTAAAPKGGAPGKKR